MHIFLIPVMYLLLSNQRVLITGAGRGIGRAIAVICAQQGAKVALLSRTLAELHETSQLCPKDSALCIICDVTSEASVEKAVHTIQSEWGGLDVLINNAGGAQRQKGPSWELKSDDLYQLLDLNVVAVHRVIKHVLKITDMLTDGGRIVNVSSRAGKQGLPGMSHYVTSKFALEGLTASLAAELVDQKVQVNSISPGMVDTRSFPKAPNKAGVRLAESIADGLLLLLTSDVTGHFLHVDELDQVRDAGRPDEDALKLINEPTFTV